MNYNHLNAGSFRTFRPCEGVRDGRVYRPSETGWPKEIRHLKRARFWLDLQSQYDIAVVEREKAREIAKRVRPADAA